MNYLLVIKLIGSVLKIEALLMIVPFCVSLIIKSGDSMYFLYTLIPLFIFGHLLSIVKPRKPKFRIREGYLAVALSWIALSVFGAVPFYLSGQFGPFIDCFFEIISGFSTTGATILYYVEPVTNGLLFWRSFTQWIGGMGVLVFVLALIPNLDSSTYILLRAEVPGPSPEKLVPKIKETAKIMYSIYIVMTIVQCILLLIAGLSIYDSVIISLGSAGTGGFSNMNLSFIAYDNIAAEIITTIFVLLFGINFNMYYYILNKQYSIVKRNEELRLYLSIIAISSFLIAANIAHQYDNSVFTALRHATFQVSSVITTTCFSTTDFNLWPTFSKIILVLLMFIGSCAGSTGGGIKVCRLLIMFKSARKEINSIIHPKRIQPIKLENSTLNRSVLGNILVFLTLYIVIALISMLIISLDGFDFETTVTSVISALGNIGQGIGLIGPTGNFKIFSPLSKLVLSFCMLAGRLEVFPMIILFSPEIWGKKRI